MKIIDQIINEEITVRKADIQDCTILIDLFIETANWLRNQGLKQWGHFLDGYGRDDVLDNIVSGAAYVFLRNGHLIGTVTVQANPDEWDQHIWAGSNVEDSLFIHRLAISRKESGRGLGGSILNWIEYGIELPENKNYLKLDCVGDNLKLNEYYKQRGYQYLGQTEDGHSKYQKEITV